MPINIRPATTADIAAIVRVTNSAFTVEEFLEGDRCSPELIQRLMQDHDFFIAEESGEAIATVYCIDKRGTGLLSMLAVLPAAQGKGVGAKMVAHVEQHLRRSGCHTVEMITLSLRSDLPAYYARFGYAPVREEPFTPVRKLRHGAKCHAVILAKAL